MKILQNICFVLLLTTFSSVYGGSCWDGDVDDCRVEAEQGKSWAQYNLGLIYSKGQSVPQDYKEAVKWFRMSAEQGNSDSQNILGSMYYEGLGVIQDYKESVKWYRLSSEQGLAGAQFSLGLMYYEGKGVLQDYKESVKWWRKAAEQGSDSAQISLGSAYSLGKGVPQDYVMAHMYFNIGSVSGRKDAIQGRGIVETVMTSSQLEKSQDLAREWMRTHQ
jgi:uncharacterized protein